MEQVLDRRFTRLSKGEGKIPTVLLIDGGKGQLTQAKEILEKHQLPEIVLVGIAKGISRRAGQETVFLSSEIGYREIAMKSDSPGLHLLQQIRDEAHRLRLPGIASADARPQGVEFREYPRFRSEKKAGIINALWRTAGDYESVARCNRQS